MCDTSDESEDDVIKLNSIITIVKLTVQADKIDRRIAELQNGSMNDREIGTIKNLTAAQKSMNDSIISLSKEKTSYQKQVAVLLLKERILGLER